MPSKISYVRDNHGKPAVCEYCKKKILLSPEDQNTVVEMEPSKNGTNWTRRFRHAWCG